MEDLELVYFACDNLIHVSPKVTIEICTGMSIETIKMSSNKMALAQVRLYQSLMTDQSNDQFIVSFDWSILRFSCNRTRKNIFGRYNI